MNQALELFELLQAKRAGDVVRHPTVEAQHIEAQTPRAEPLSFLTLTTVEGIVSGMDLGNLQDNSLICSTVLIRCSTVYSSCL